MQTILNRLLLVVVTLLVLTDTSWLVLEHFTIDAKGYFLLFASTSLLAVAAYYYDEIRKEAAISATLACTAFLLVFSAGADLTSYLLVTITGPRIDHLLAAADAVLGFHWPTIMAFAADHPLINKLLGLSYVSVMPQTAILLLVLGWRNDLENLYGFSLALAFGAIITLSIWTAFPSFGAFSVYILPNSVASKLGLVLGFDYAHSLVQMLKFGPGFISPKELRGIVGFPSYHTLQAVVLVWYARKTPLRWPAIVLNIAVLLSTPIQGGHHLVDILGGFCVTLLAVWLSGRTIMFAQNRSLAREDNIVMAPQGGPVS